MAESLLFELLIWGFQYGKMGRVNLLLLKLMLLNKLSKSYWPLWQGWKLMVGYRIGSLRTDFFCNGYKLDRKSIRFIIMLEKFGRSAILERCKGVICPLGRKFEPFSVWLTLWVVHTRPLWQPPKESHIQIDSNKWIQQRIFDEARPL